MGVDVITLDERSNIDFLINVSYHSIRGKETYQKKKIFHIERLVLIVILLIQSFIDQQRFLFPLHFPQAIETKWHFVFILSYVASLFLSVQFGLKAQRQLVNVDDSISNNSPYCIIARTRARVHSMFDTWQGEKGNI